MLIVSAVETVIGKRVERVLQGISPARRDYLEIAVVLGDAMFVNRFITVARYDLQIEWQANGKIGLKR